MNFEIFWRKYGQHITAFSVVLLLIYSGIEMHNYINLQKEISENCGWGEDNYYCYCEKGTAMEMKNKIQGMENKINLSNITLEDNWNVTLDR